MRNPPRVKSLLCAWALGWAAVQVAWAQPPAAAAEPEARADALISLLTERGLLRIDTSIKEGAALVQHMRDAASDLVISAMNFIGVTYRRGGDSAEEGFDCSGFTRYVYQNSIGLVLPRRADEQAQSSKVTPIGLEDLKPGDLVFFNTLRRAFSHVGIYVGDGKFIHSPRSGQSVRIDDMNKSYWVSRFNGARRVNALSTDSAGSTATSSASR